MIAFLIGCFLFQFVLGSHEDPKTEILTYDVIFRKKIIGEYESRRTTDKALVTYQNCADIQVKIIKDISVSYYFHAIYEDGHLNKSVTTITLNEDIHKETMISRVGDRYLIQKDLNEAWFDDSITYSSIMLMFEEPFGINQSFSEQDADMHSIIHLDNHTYIKKNTKGNTDRYQYQNGKLDKAKIDAGMIKFSLIKRNP